MGLFDEFKTKKLIKDLGNWDKDVRENSVKSLEELGELAVEPLVRALKDENEVVRWSVAGILGDIGGERAVEPLIQALKDEDRYVRRMAASSIAKIGDIRAFEPAMQVLKDEERYDQEKALEDLGKIGEPAVEPSEKISKYKKGTGISDKTWIRPIFEGGQTIGGLYSGRIHIDGPIRCYHCGHIEDMGITPKLGRDWICIAHIPLFPLGICAIDNCYKCKKIYRIPLNDEDKIRLWEFAATGWRNLGGYTHIENLGRKGTWRAHIMSGFIGAIIFYFLIGGLMEIIFGINKIIFIFIGWIVGLWFLNKYNQEFTG